MTAAMLPCALLWLIVCSFLSKLLPARWQFDSGNWAVPGFFVLLVSYVWKEDEVLFQKTTKEQPR